MRALGLLVNLVICYLWRIITVFKMYKILWNTSYTSWVETGNKISRSWDSAQILITQRIAILFLIRYKKVQIDYITKWSSAICAMLILYQRPIWFLICYCEKKFINVFAMTCHISIYGTSVLCLFFHSNYYHRETTYNSKIWRIIICACSNTFIF